MQCGDRHAFFLYTFKKSMTGLKLSREQYAFLIRDIEKSLKSHVTGGAFGFEPPDTMPYLHDLTFFVEDDRFQGGGFFSSIGKAFKKVYGALKKSGVIDKAKDAALKKGRELGGKAIDAAAKKVESEAAKRGVDVSRFTEAAASKAHEHLHEAEGHLSKKLDEGQKKLERKAGVEGSGHGKHFRGGDMYEAGSPGGSGMYQTRGPGGSGMYRAQPGGGSMYGASYIHAPTTYGIPRGAMQVSATNHLHF
jgi:hypothetical protein